mgnify:CR=1 FL=1
MQEGTRVKHTEKIKMSLKGIQHTYYSAAGEETKAIEDISIDVKEGEFLAIVGASGCGKSTLFNLLLRFEREYLGKILVGKYSIEEYSKDEYAKIMTCVSQQPYLFHMSIYDNLALINSDMNKIR